MNDERRYRIAVWIVIASEALLFAGLFALYATYRSEHTRAFEAGIRTNIAWIGGVNTLLLLSSSFAIAWAILRVRQGRRATFSLLAVLLLGSGFLVFKSIEWTLHVREGIVPGLAYAGPEHGHGTSLFFTLYYAMTGLHALHVIAGLALVLWVFVRPRRRHLALELVAVYWHFVDVIWVFLWPMFYLMHG